MKELRIGGHVVEFDDNFDDFVSRHKWAVQRGGKNYYAVTTINGRRVAMHRLVIGAPPGVHVDHIDGNGLNNRRANLRICTLTQNLQNGRWRNTKGRTSRFKGVWRIKRQCRRCWRSAITANRVRGVRCALCWNLETARLARQHNDANALSLGERMIPLDLALQIVDTWLTTPFEGGRHARRIAMIDES
jgi:hypothetical protein